MVKFGAFLKKQIEGDEWKDHYLKVCNTHSHCARKNTLNSSSSFANNVV